MKYFVILEIIFAFQGSVLGFLFDDLINPENNFLNLNGTSTFTETQLETLLLRKCYQCHGTSISSVTSSCWETVDESDVRFVRTVSCTGTCSITVLNHTAIGLVDYTRRCEPRDCNTGCYKTDDTVLCKHCCYGDKCNDALPNYVPESHDRRNGVSEINLREWLGNTLFKPRHHASDPSNKVATRKFIRKTLGKLGMTSELQSFKVVQTTLEKNAPPNFRSYIRTVVLGYNIISVIRGRYYNTIHDRLIVIMAHYDTHDGGSPGVDDNASGVVGLLEVGRLLTNNITCSRNFSVILVFTDFKEEGNFYEGLANSGYTNCFASEEFTEGLTGSSHFLCGWLLPFLKKTGARVTSAVNMESLLNYDIRPNSQIVPTLSGVSSGRSGSLYQQYLSYKDKVKKRKYAGDWILISYANVHSRPHAALYFADVLSSSWNVNSHELNAPVIKLPVRLDGNEQKLMRFDDCLPFLYLRQPLPCISITDTGSQRGYMKRCYNELCDDKTNLNRLGPTAFQFLSKAVEAVWKFAEQLSQGDCQPPNQQVNTNQSLTTPNISKRSCDEELIKNSFRDNNGLITLSATCRATRSILELCDLPENRAWATLNSGTAWIPKKAKKSTSRHLWFKVSFARVMNITKVAIQGVPRKGYIRGFMISLSDDGTTWNWYVPDFPEWKSGSRRTELAGNVSGKRIKTQVLVPPIISRFIRIHPRRWKSRIALRLELYGCPA